MHPRVASIRELGSLRSAQEARLNVLLVKTSSLGDIVANLPVVADILRWRPDTRVDWVVEEAFAELVRLHPGVDNVIEVAQRRWRKDLLSPAYRAERRTFAERLRGCRYDFIIDTQGLVKSALIAWSARGMSVGYGWSSAREPLAALAFDRTVAVPRGLHAIERNRRLAAAALGYRLRDPADFGLRCPRVPPPAKPGKFWVALHGSSRDEKLWPEERWRALGVALARRGLDVVLPWGSEGERARSERLSRAMPRAVVAPGLGLPAVANLLGRACFAVGVDTGLTHLAAALGVPVAALFSHSDPVLSGVRGQGPCINLGGPARAPQVRDVIAAVDALVPGCAGCEPAIAPAALSFEGAW